MFKKKKRKQVTNSTAITGTSTIIGGRAAVVVNNTATYFIWGLDKWREDWLHKKIKVIGDIEKGNKGEDIIKEAVLQKINE